MIDFKCEAEKYRKEFITLLNEWVSIPSVLNAATADESMPFGKEIHDALEWFKALGDKEGFITKNIDGYAAHIEYGTGDEYVYVFGHCDVVPPGEGWSSEPFKLLKCEDKLIGRGVVDDKGPLIAAYLALKLLKDNDIELKRKIRIVAGGNEESGFRCIKHYFSKEPKPTYGFTPDAKFPVINGEKGGAVIQISGNIDSGDIVIEGGTAHNIIPGCVTVKNCSIEGHSHSIKHFIEKEDLDIKIFKDENKKEGFKLLGKGGHSAKPEKANNPIEKVLKLLKIILCQSWIEDFEALFGGDNRYGELYSLNLTGRCGVLTIVPTIIKIENGEFNITLSVRYPENTNMIYIVQKIKDYFISNGLDNFKVNSSGIKKPSYVSEDSPLVKKLYSIYLKHTEDTINKVRVTSAGTYAAEMENSVVFGCEFPDGSSGNTHMAQEYGSEDAFIKAIGIYAEALYELSML